MNGLRATDLLRLLETGHGRSPLERGLLLVAHAWPEAGPDILRALPVAERDRLLAALRRATFGRAVGVTTRCPECETELETPLDLDLLLAEPAPDDAFSVHDCVHEHRALRFRLPSTDDLLAVLASSSDPRLSLIRRTVEVPAPQTLHGISEQALDALTESLSAAWEAVDPLSEVRLEFDCVQCEHRFTKVFDIAEAFFTEVEAHGRRLLLDIHALASAYGWTEDIVLALGPVRRRLYVDMVSR